MADTFQPFEYRGYRVEMRYNAHRGYTSRWMWEIIHPTEQGRCMPAKTRKDAKKIIDCVHNKMIKF